MEEIIKYLTERDIKAKIQTDNFTGTRFKFKIGQCQIVIPVRKGLTLELFKMDADSQYQECLMKQAIYYEGIANSCRERSENFKSIWTQF